MGKIHLLFVIIFFLFYQSCDKKDDRCVCDDPKNMGNQTDTFKSKETSGFDFNGNIKADADIKKMIDAGIKIDGNYNHYEENVKTTVNTIIDKFPEITNLQRFELDFYCRYIQIICKNKSLTDADVYDLKLKKHDIIHDIIQKCFLERINKKPETHREAKIEQVKLGARIQNQTIIGTAKNVHTINQPNNVHIENK